MNKQMTDEEIEEEITHAFTNMMGMRSGERNFSNMALDMELLNNPRFSAIEALAFEVIVKKAEDMFLMGTDIQNILDILRDISTFPSEHYKFFADNWNCHKKIFKKCIEKNFSVLSLDTDLDSQFNELKDNIFTYESDVKKLYQAIQNSVIIYKNRDEYDKTDVQELDRRLEVLSGFMLSDLTDNQIINCRKILLSYALNADMENVLDNYDLCLKYVYEKYFMAIDGNKKIPVTDMLIADAILYSNNYTSVDITQNIDLFIRAYKYTPAMNEQFKLMNKVYQYLDLNISI